MKFIRKIMSVIKKIKIFDIIIFATIITIWGYIAYMFSPGIMTSDSINQWEQVCSNTINDIHSPLHTIIEMGLSKIWKTPKIVCLFQIFVFALIWTIICRKLRNDNKVVGVLQIIGTLLIAIMPINYMYSITLWKDILYSYIILIIVYYIYLGIKRNFKYKTSQIIMMSLFFVLAMKMRHNGVLIGIFLIPIISFLIWKRTKSKKDIIKLLSFVAVFLICVKLLLLCFNVSYSATKLNKKWFTLYKVGVLYQNDAITDEADIKVLEDIMPLEKWNQYTWDYTWNGLVFAQEMDYKKVNEHMDGLWNMMIKYAIKNPKIMIKHYYRLTSVIWQLDEPENSYTSIIQPITYVQEGELAHRTDRDYMKIANKVIKSMGDYKIVYRPAIYMYASIIIIILIVILTKKKEYWLLISPMIINAISLVPMMTGQDVRYLYCNFLTLYFIVFAIFDILRNNCIETIKENKKENIGKRCETNKVLVIVPAYNEEGAIRKTVDAIYKENENCDVLVVNDCSTDKTIAEIKKTKAKWISLPNNLGIGGAVQSGYIYALKNNYDIAIQVDGDGQHDPRYIKEMVKEIYNGNDMVIGSRFVKKTKYKQTFMRMLGISITSEIIKLFTDKKIFDTTSGLRAVNRGIIEMFAKDYPYDYPEPCTTMQMILKGKKVKEIQVEMKQRTTGVSSISPLKSVSYMLKVTLSLVLLGIKKD